MASSDHFFLFRIHLPGFCVPHVLLVCDRFSSNDVSCLITGRSQHAIQPHARGVFIRQSESRLFLASSAVVLDASGMWIRIEKFQYLHCAFSVCLP